MIENVMKVKIPRILIAAPKSGGGKTTVVTALLKAFSSTGKKIASYKVGPDYIDTMFHSYVTKSPSRNLDTFLVGEDMCKYIIASNSEYTDISIIEGVMGYYDGTGEKSTNSTYDLAKLLDTPVILVIDAKGMAISICALIDGFVNFREKSNIKGVILNNISQKMYSYYKNLIEKNTDVKVYGYMPTMENCQLKSRHLGLVSAEEVENLEFIIETLGEKAKETIDLDSLYKLAITSSCIEYKKIEIEKYEEVKIAVAYDKAFCFYYRDSLNVLEKMGAKLIYFSPLSDKKIPDDVCGIILGGGYPELNIEELSNNKTLIYDIQNKIKNNIPIYAECGGYMYLLESFKDSNDEYYLANIFPGKSFMTKSLKNFGYTTLISNCDNIMCKKGETINAHEFHYSDSTNLGNSFTAVKPYTGDLRKTIIADGNKFAGYPHIHFLGNINFSRNYIKKCIEYKKNIQCM